MTKPTEKEIRHLLQQAMPAQPNTELQRDLWTDMLRRLDRQPAHLPRAAIPWFDWALVAALCTGLFFFPGAILPLLFHL